AAARLVGPLGIDAETLPPETALGPRLANLVREAMATAGGDPAAAGPLVEQGLAAWADEVAGLVSLTLAETRPDAAITSLFGVEVLKGARPPCLWGVINSTFYIGPNPPPALRAGCSAARASAPAALRR